MESCWSHFRVVPSGLSVVCCLLSSDFARSVQPFSSRFGLFLEPFSSRNVGMFFGRFAVFLEPFWSRFGMVLEGVGVEVVLRVQRFPDDHRGFRREENAKKEDRMDGRSNGRWVITTT